MGDFAKPPVRMRLPPALEHVVYVGVLGESVPAGLTSQLYRVTQEGALIIAAVTGSQMKRNTVYQAPAAKLAFLGKHLESAEWESPVPGGRTASNVPEEFDIVVAHAINQNGGVILAAMENVVRTLAVNGFLAAMPALLNGTIEDLRMIPKFWRMKFGAPMEPVVPFVLPIAQPNGDATVLGDLTGFNFTPNVVHCIVHNATQYYVLVTANERLIMAVEGIAFNEFSPAGLLWILASSTPEIADYCIMAVLASKCPCVLQQQEIRAVPLTDLPSFRPPPPPPPSIVAAPEPIAAPSQPAPSSRREEKEDKKTNQSSLAAALGGLTSKLASGTEKIKDIVKGPSDDGEERGTTRSRVMKRSTNNGPRKAVATPTQGKEKGGGDSSGDEIVSSRTASGGGPPRSASGGNDTTSLGLGRTSNVTTNQSSFAATNAPELMAEDEINSSSFSPGAPDEGPGGYAPPPPFQGASAAPPPPMAAPGPASAPPRPMAAAPTISPYDGGPGGPGSPMGGDTDSRSLMAGDNTQSTQSGGPGMHSPQPLSSPVQAHGPGGPVTNATAQSGRGPPPPPSTSPREGQDERKGGDDIEMNNMKTAPLSEDLTANKAKPINRPNQPGGGKINKGKPPAKKKPKSNACSQAAIGGVESCADLLSTTLTCGGRKALSCVLSPLTAIFYLLVSIVFLIPGIISLLIASPKYVETTAGQAQVRSAERQRSRKKRLLSFAVFTGLTLPMMFLLLVLPIILVGGVFPGLSVDGVRAALGVYLGFLVLLQILGVIRASQTALAATANTATDMFVKIDGSFPAGSKRDLKKQPPIRRKKPMNYILSIALLYETISLCLFPFQLVNLGSDDTSNTQQKKGGTLQAITQVVYIYFPTDGLSYTLICAWAVAGLLVAVFCGQVAYELYKTKDLKKAGNVNYFFKTVVGSVIYGHGLPDHVARGVKMALSITGDSLFLLIVTQLLNSLTCIDTPNGVFLRNAPLIRCWTGPHIGWAATSLVILAYYIPLAVMITPSMSQTKPGHDMALQKRYVMAANILKVAFTLAAVVGATTPLARIVLAALLSIALLILTAVWAFRAQNFKGPSSQTIVNYWKMGSLVAATVSCFLALAIYSGGAVGFSPATFQGMWGGVILFIMLLTLLAYALWRFDVCCQDSYIYIEPAEAAPVTAPAPATPAAAASAASPAAPKDGAAAEMGRY